jgi:hypothetical protein
VARMGEERKVYKVLVEKTPLEDRGVDGKKESERILGRLARGVEWIQLAQDRNRWRSVVNTVMNLCALVPRS